MRLRFRGKGEDETEANYRSARSKIARFGIAAGAFWNAAFLCVFGGFFGGLPLFMLIGILHGTNEADGSVGLICVFISIFVISGLCILVSGIRKAVKTICMIKNAPPVKAVSAEAVCPENEPPAPGAREFFGKILGDIRDYRRGKLIVPNSVGTVSSVPMTWKQRLPLAIFGAIFLAVGTGLLAFGISNYIKNQRAAETWVPVPCEITSASLEENRGKRGRTSYSPELTYRYVYDGKTFSGDEISLVVGFSGRHSEASRELKRLKKYKTCWVDPENPGDAVLEKPEKEFSFRKIMLVVFGAPFALAGGFIVFFGIFGNVFASKKKTERGELLPEKKSVVGVFFCAAFWNSIVSVFICALLAQETFDWKFALILLPFVVIGLVLLFCAMNALRQQVGAALYALKLAPANLVSGKPVRVSWKLQRGDAEKLSRLSLYFTETERDTDTSVNGEAVQRIVERTLICDSGARVDFRSGACDFVPPEDHPTVRRFFAFELEIEYKSALLGKRVLRFPVKLKKA